MGIRTALIAILGGTIRESQDPVINHLKHTSLGHYPNDAPNTGVSLNGSLGHPTASLWTLAGGYLVADHPRSDYDGIPGKRLRYCKDVGEVSTTISAILLVEIVNPSENECQGDAKSVGIYPPNIGTSVTKY